MQTDIIIVNLREFTGDDIVNATSNMSNIIGQGGFGKVYRGTYKHLLVAVKVLKEVIKMCLIDFHES